MKAVLTQGAVLVGVAGQSPRLKFNGGDEVEG